MFLHACVRVFMFYVGSYVVYANDPGQAVMGQVTDRWWHCNLTVLWTTGKGSMGLTL